MSNANICDGQLSERKDNKEVKIGLEVKGGIIILTNNFTVSIPVSLRLSDNFELEVKPILGRISAISLFGNLRDVNPVDYGGLVLGGNVGRYERCFEFELGLAHVFGDGNFQPNPFPVLAIGYVRKINNFKLASGLGFPYGAYLSAHYDL